MHVRHPIWLRLAGQPGAVVFAAMFTIESASRALLSTVVTVQALTLLEDPRSVSVIFSLVGVTGLAGSFAIPALVHRTSRRAVYSLGAVLLVAAAVALALVSVPGQIAGMLVRVFATACLGVTTSLYIMQYINKRDLTKSEPMRLQFAALAWTMGPWSGVMLYTSLGPNWAYGASIVAALVLLVFFWLLRLTDNPAIQKANRAPPNPFKCIGRFLAQPRLRLAWIITLGRSCWWVFFFIYAPIYMIEAGYGAKVGAAVISAGNALLFLTPVFGSLGTRLGIRRVLFGAYIVAGFGTFMAGFFFSNAYLVTLFLMIGAMGCVALDALGNIPYLRSVHPHERPEMTTVFRTYSDFSELVTPAIFVVILTLSDLRSVFLVFGVIVTAFAIWPLFLPRRM